MHSVRLPCYRYLPLLPNTEANLLLLERPCFNGLDPGKIPCIEHYFAPCTISSAISLIELKQKIDSPLHCDIKQFSMQNASKPGYAKPRQTHEISKTSAEMQCENLRELSRNSKRMMPKKNFC